MARRAARKAEQESKREAQLEKDLEAIDAIEVELGDSNVKVLELPYMGDGVPVAIACRTPKPIEFKRYQDTVRTKKDGKAGDPVLATEQLASVCRVYPDGETFAAMVEARPMLRMQLGTEAIKLAKAQAEEDSKD